MKIGLFTTQFEMKHVMNGISNNAYLLAKHMSDQGHDVHVYAPRFKGMTAGEEKDRIKLERFNITQVADISYFSLNAAKNAMKEDFDIVHSFHYGYFPASLGLRVAKKKKIPHLLTPTFHDVQITKLKSLLFSFYNRTEGANLLKNSTVLTYNEDEKRKLAKFAKFDGRVVPSPIQDDIFYPASKKSRTKTVIYIGAFLPWKGAKIAFDICRQIRGDVKFKFIGSGPLERELKAKAGKNFTFLKNLSVEQLAREIRNSDILLYPTAYESFGRVAAEAMMSGVPVITTKVGAMPETTGNGGILVDYGDWTRMREELEGLLENDVKRARLSKLAMTQSKKFTASRVCDRIESIYKELL